MNIKKTLHGLTRAFRNELDKGITLNLLKRFRRLAQAATRIACVLGVTGALLLSSASYAVAPIKAQIKTKTLTPKAYAKANLPLNEYKCLAILYGKESAWNERANNGLHWGIPQGRSIYLKTASGIDQVKWGIAYNMNRYGSMCEALQFFRVNNYH
jgi:hypothetical protein